jgi:Fe-S-cluster containining protein
MPLPARDVQLVQIVDAAFADAARRAGDLLACRIGCTQCCHGAFAINALDAARLREGMAALRATNPALAADLELRARAWLAEHGSGFPGNPETGSLSASAAEQAQFEVFATDAACPALDPSTGRCDVYAWRPMTCRVFGPPVRSVNDNGAEGLGHCEICFIGATPEQIAACEMPVSHALETELLDEMGSKAETVVAFALIK